MRPIRFWIVSPAGLGTSCLLSRLGVGNMPGPTDLRGARAAGLGAGWVGKWLWRRVRMAMLDAGGGMDVCECSMGGLGAIPWDLDWLKRRISEVLRAGRVSWAAVGVKEEGALTDEASVEVNWCCE